MATEKRRLWAAGCWFIYCGDSRAIKAPSLGGATIYTAGEKEARSQRLGLVLPTALNEEGRGVLGPADVVLCSDGNFVLPCVLKMERSGQVLVEMEVEREDPGVSK